MNRGIPLFIEGIELEKKVGILEGGYRTAVNMRIDKRKRL